MSKRGGVGAHPGAMIFGAVLGGAAGAVAALLYTPWSGQQLRDQLFGSVTVAAGSAASPVMEKASDVAHKGADLVAPAVDTVVAAAQKGAEKGSAVVRDATAQIQQRAGGSPSAEEPALEEPPDGKPITTL